MKKLLAVAVLMIAFCAFGAFSASAEMQEKNERNAKAMSGFGLVADWRMKLFFAGGFYSGSNKYQYFWTAEDVRFETNARNIQTSETSISDHQWMGILVGKPF